MDTKATKYAELCKELESNSQRFSEQKRRCLELALAFVQELQKLLGCDAQDIRFLPWDKRPSDSEIVSPQWAFWEGDDGFYHLRLVVIFRPASIPARPWPLELSTQLVGSEFVLAVDRAAATRLTTVSAERGALADLVRPSVEAWIGQVQERIRRDLEIWVEKSAKGPTERPKW